MTEARSTGKFNKENQSGVVQDIFSSIAPYYDLLNHVLSFGQDIYWRKKTLQHMHFFKTYKCVDLATGTGDVALAVAKKFPEVATVGVDFSPAMIAIANKKKSNRKAKAFLGQVAFQHGDATRLPFADASFDVAVMAFGIRNIPDKQTALNEMSRVVVPGGQVLILEMVSQQNKFFQALYQAYLCNVLPRIARLFSSHRTAYYYLGQSIVHFPSMDQFCMMMQKSGLRVEKIVSMTFGITRLFVGKK